MTGPTGDVGEFGASFKKFMEHVSAAAPRPDDPIQRRLLAHLQAEPASLKIVRESFPDFEHPNLQLALDAVLAEPECRSETFGVTTRERMYTGLDLATLLVGNGQAREAPVDYERVTLDAGRVVVCISSGVILLSHGESRLACLISSSRRPFESGVVMHVAGTSQDAAEQFLSDLRRAMHARNVYRGRVISLATNMHRGLELRFHSLPPVRRDQIILPETVLRRVEEQTIGFSESAARLQAAGRHLKRGVLLHGPPGTGKTLTAMHLAHRMAGRTTLLVTGAGQGLIERVCQMARFLSPATVIIEDVDLIASDREQSDQCAGPLLFELLNQMDGLSEDTDILFLLTTNRPGQLEPALAARPGRIDMAVEIPLPDRECRARLFGLYAKGLQFEVANLDRFLAKSEGASAAFIREVLRKAALIACRRPGTITVSDQDLDMALDELVVGGGSLTRALLGAGSMESEVTISVPP